MRNAANSKPLRRFFRQYLPRLPVVIGLGLAGSALEGVGIAALMPLIGLLSEDSASTATLGKVFGLFSLIGVEERKNQIVFLSFLIVGLLSIKAAITAANNIYIARVRTIISRDLLRSIAGRILSLPYKFFFGETQSRLMNTMALEHWRLDEVIAGALFTIQASTGLLVILAILFWLDWHLLLVVLAFALIMVAVLAPLERAKKRHSKLQVSYSDRLTARMLEIVQGVRTIRLFGQRQREVGRFNEASGALFDLSFSIERIQSFVKPTMEILVAILFLTLIAVAYMMSTPVPTVVAFAVLLTRAQPYAQQITVARSLLASRAGSTDEIEWLLGQESEPDSDTQGVIADPIAGAIAFNALTYSYPGRSAVLTDATFRIEDGASVALLGRSGAGKSTVVNLLCRLVDPVSGAITVGGRNIDSWSMAAWRSRIAVAGQDALLLGGSLRENLLFGNSNAPPEDTELAIEIAGVGQFLEKLPRGLETQVGEDGLGLSGGQRQRIALARALIRRPDLLILDEATSALDGLAENEIMSKLMAHRMFRTLIVISHRLSTVQRCEFGIVLEDGRVSEIGKLADLDYRNLSGCLTS